MSTEIWGGNEERWRICVSRIPESSDHGVMLETINDDFSGIDIEILSVSEAQAFGEALIAAAAAAARKVGIPTSE